MKKFLFIIPVIALLMAVGASAETNTKRKTIDGACAGTAVEKRENALIAGLDTFNTGMKTSLTARTASLKDAWAKTTNSERMSARKEGRQAFESASKSARTAMRTARKSAWDTFKTDIKACGGTGMEESSPTKSTDVTVL